MPKRRELTLDEQLVAFLDQWEATRTAQATKHRLQAEHYRREIRSGNRYWQICYERARRAQQHYEHEIEMLQELRRRTFAK